MRPRRSGRRPRSRNDAAPSSSSGTGAPSSEDAGSPALRRRSTQRAGRRARRGDTRPQPAQRRPRPPPGRLRPAARARDHDGRDALLRADAAVLVDVAARRSRRCPAPSRSGRRGPRSTGTTGTSTCAPSHEPRGPALPHRRPSARCSGELRLRAAHRAGRASRGPSRRPPAVQPASSSCADPELAACGSRRRAAAPAASRRGRACRCRPARSRPARRARRCRRGPAPGSPTAAISLRSASAVSSAALAGRATGRSPAPPASRRIAGETAGLPVGVIVGSAVRRGWTSTVMPGQPRAPRRAGGRRRSGARR